MQRFEAKRAGAGGVQPVTLSDVANPLVVAPEHPMVSVIIPAFNRNDTLPRALMSVIQQTFRQLEIIVVDDGSAQPVEQVALSLGDPRVRVLVLPTNRGANAARNTGIAAAKGKYIAFLDSDDEWHPEKLRIQVAAMEAAPSSVAAHYTGRTKFSAAGEKLFQRSPELSGYIFQNLLRHNEIGPLSSVLVRSTVIKEVGLFDESLPSSQDWDLYLRIAERHEFGSVRDSLVRYHSSSDSISFNVRAKALGRKRILEKYEAQMARFPKALAANLVKAGHYHCRMGALPEGRRFFRRAIRVRPLSISAYLFLSISLLGVTSYQGLVKLRNAFWNSF